MKTAMVIGFVFAAVVGALVAAPPTSAHHSFASGYDSSRELTLEGIVREVRWKNPHVRFDLEVTAGAEVGKVYDIETASVSALRQRNISESFISAGDHIEVFGNPARRQANGIYLRNILLASGEELALEGDEPRFSEAQIGTSGPVYATEGDGSQPRLGIFRVWSSARNSFPFQEDVGAPELARTLYPLTDAARAALESFDPVGDNPLANCAPKGMPTILEEPYPMEFLLSSDGDILQELEEYDSSRAIHMDSEENPSDHPISLLGFSQGHWDGDTLVVQTSRVDWPWFDTVGVPLDPNAVFVERYTPTKDGSRLDLSITIIAPETFTRPVEVSKYYFFIPDVERRPYNCVP